MKDLRYDFWCRVSDDSADFIVLIENKSKQVHIKYRHGMIPNVFREEEWSEDKFLDSGYERV